MLLSVDKAIGNVAERLVRAHHGRRLRRLGWGRALEPRGDALWAAGEDGVVLKLDPMTLAVTATISTGQYGWGGPFGLAISPDGARVYATASQSSTLYIISEPTPNSFTVSSVYLGGEPRRIAFSADGATAVVSNYASGVQIIQ